MRKFFDMDNPVMRFLSWLADMIILNFLTMICCIPVFTAGAAISAMYYVELKWVRKEEGYIIRTFFRQFRDNFRQATAEWLLILLAAVVLIADFYMFRTQPDVFPQVIEILVIAFAVIVLLVAVWVFPLQSHFVNSVKNTFRNAAILGIAKLPRSIGMVAGWTAAVLLMYLSLTTVLMVIFPLVFMFVFSLPGYLCCRLVDKPFSLLEPDTPEESVEESEEEKEEAFRILREESAIRHDPAE